MVSPELRRPTIEGNHSLTPAVTSGREADIWFMALLGPIIEGAPPCQRHP